MSTDHILALLLVERDKLTRAIEVLSSSPKLQPKKPMAVETSGAVPKKRHVSGAARKRMAAAQKKRWAAIKATQK